MIGIMTTMLIIGWLILLAIAIWVIYRVVMGALALNEQPPDARDAHLP